MKHVSRPGVARSHRALNFPDVLAQILEFTLVDRRQVIQGRAKIPPMTTAEPPWPYLLVCKFWHDVTLNTPFLWSTFIANMSVCPEKPISHLPFMLDKHLERSRNSPLTLAFLFMISTSAIHGKENPFTTIRTLLLKAQESRDRWREVNIRIITVAERMAGPLDSTEISICLGDAPILKSFNIVYEVPKGYLRIQLQLSPCPLLKSLSIIGPVKITHPKSTDRTGNVYFPKLAGILWRSHLVQPLLEYRTLMEHAANVQKVTLGLWVGEASTVQDAHSPTISLPKLRILTFEKGFDTLQTLSTPSLARLELQGFVALENNFTNLAAKLRSVPLIYLSINFNDYQISEASVETRTFLAFMESVGHLRYLKVKCCRISLMDVMSTALLQSLHAGKTTVLSQLSTLELDFRTAIGAQGCDTVFPALKRLIIACSKKYSTNFLIRVSFGDWLEDAKLYLSRDPEIIACCTETFTILVKG